MKARAVLWFTVVTGGVLVWAQKVTVKKIFYNYPTCENDGPTACIICDPLCKDKDAVYEVGKGTNEGATRRNPNCWGKDAYHCGKASEKGNSCTYTWYKDGSEYTALELKNNRASAKDKSRTRCAYRCPDDKKNDKEIDSKYYLFTELLSKGQKEVPALQLSQQSGDKLGSRMLKDTDLVEEIEVLARGIYKRQQKRMERMTPVTSRRSFAPSTALTVAIPDPSRLLLESAYKPHEPISRYRSAYFKICLDAPPLDPQPLKRQLRAWKTPCDYEVVNTCSNEYMNYKDTLPILDRYCQILYDFYCCIVQLGCDQSWDESLSDLEQLLDPKKCVNETWAPRDSCTESRGQLCAISLGNPEEASCQTIADFRYCMQNSGCNDDPDFEELLKQVDIIDDKCQFQCNRCDPGCKNKARCKDFFGCVECNLTTYLDKSTLPFVCVKECPSGYFPNNERECSFCDPLASKLPDFCPDGVILTTLSPVIWITALLVQIIGFFRSFHR